MRVGFGVGGVWLSTVGACMGSHGCGASLITILGMQRLGKEEDECKVFALADSDYCKALSTARKPKKKTKPQIVA